MAAGGHSHGHMDFESVMPGSEGHAHGGHSCEGHSHEHHNDLDGHGHKAHTDVVPQEGRGHNGHQDHHHEKVPSESHGHEAAHEHGGHSCSGHGHGHGAGADGHGAHGHGAHGHGAHGHEEGHSGHSHRQAHDHDAGECCGHAHEEDSSDSDGECCGHDHGDGGGHGHEHAGHGGHGGHGEASSHGHGAKTATPQKRVMIEEECNFSDRKGTREMRRSGTVSSWVSMFSASVRKSKSRLSFAQREVCSACCGHGSSAELCAITGCKPHEMVKTKFSIRNICCDSEVKLIQKIVEPLKGVESVSTNPFTKLTVVAHCPVACCSSPESILEKLNNAGLGAALLGQNQDDDEEGVDIPLWCWQHLRHFSFAISLVLLITGIALTSVGEKTMGMVCEVVAMALGVPFIIFEAIVTISKYQLDMAVLVLIASGGAAAQGEAVDGALVIVLYNLAKVLESSAMSRVSRSLRAVMQLQSIRMVSLADGQLRPISDLKEGDVVTLRPGEECPADGTVTRGWASCSEAALTGEARPVEKKKESPVSSGTVILNGYVEVTLQKAGNESTLAMIESQVQEAQMKRTSKQLLIARFARIWTPAVILLVIVVVTIVPRLTDGDFRTWRERGLVILLTACPCAIVIGAPLATTCAVAAAATRGLFIKQPETVEQLPAIKSVGLDKTGTLTTGEFGVRVQESFDSNYHYDVEPLKLAAALEMKSAHPIAAAIVSKAVGCAGEAYEHDALPGVKKFLVLDGIGIQGNVKVGGTGSSAKVLVGNKKVLDAAKADPTAHSKFTTFQDRHPNDTTVAVVVDGRLALGLALNDTIRPDAAQMVSELRQLGCEARILTGDAESAGRSVAEAVGIDPQTCHFSMHPEEKRAWVQGEETQRRPTLMLGDGINDATALATATVGAAMGESSAALAAKSADMVLMTDKLIRLPQCISLCRYASWIQRINLAVPCLVKLIEVGFALTGHLKLWMAIVCDLGTLLLVLLLGVTILSRRFWREVPRDYAVFVRTASTGSSADSVHL